MATVSKASQKKVVKSGKLLDKKIAKKSSARKGTTAKEGSMIVLKTTAEKTATLKKSVKAPIKNSAKEIGLGKLSPVNVLVDKEPVKTGAAKLVTKPKKPAKNNTGQINKTIDIPLTAIADTKKAVSISTDPLLATQVASTTNTTSLPQIYTSPIAQPDFRSGKSDGYQSKIQAGNKSKSGIKPSGKKPLW